MTVIIIIKTAKIGFAVSPRLLRRTAHVELWTEARFTLANVARSVASKNVVRADELRQTRSVELTTSD